MTMPVLGEFKSQDKCRGEYISELESKLTER